MTADLLRAGRWRSEQIGESGVAIELVVGTEALGGEVEEQTLGEVLFVFDEGDEGSGFHERVYGFISTGVPTGTMGQIASISSLVSAMQPAVQSK